MTDFRDIPALVQFAHQQGLDPMDLDDHVRDCTERDGATAANHTGNHDEQDQALDDADARATTANNAGLDGQIAFLAQHLGLDTTRRILVEVAGGTR